MKKYFLIGMMTLLFSAGSSALAQNRNSWNALYDTTDSITQNCTTDYQKAQKIYEWISANIEYDVDLVESIFIGQLLLVEQYDGSYSRIAQQKLYKEVQQEMLEFNNRQLQSGVEVFAMRRGICSSIANLYQLMCQHAGIPCEMITGVVKFKLESDDFFGEKCVISLGHVWNILLIDGRTVLADPTLGLSDTRYFDVRPDKLIFTHLPFNPKNQLLKDPISKKDYVKLPAPSSSDYWIYSDLGMELYLARHTKMAAYQKNHLTIVNNLWNTFAGLYKHYNSLYTFFQNESASIQ